MTYEERAGLTDRIPYFDALEEGEKEEVRESLKLLFRQTFVLEYKYDKRSKRFTYNQEFKICNKHLEFIRAYLSVAGVSVLENSQLGLIYIQGEDTVGEKLPKLATLYLLVLKLIYDEQMAAVSSSVNVYTTLSEIHEKLGSYRLFQKQPSATEIRRALALLKKYQVLEPLDILEDLDPESRMIIYPCINVVLLGDDVRALLESFGEGDNSDDEPEL
ncbi:MAG: DUF4194 domain-containing protein [Lacrimispora sp.]|uniref:DUF4194 domain-containing protein n=1 Tax=Lacrimispora sp. TaxID=2719234 RepID=UPI0039E3AEF1